MSRSSLHRLPIVGLFLLMQLIHAFAQDAPPQTIQNLAGPKGQIEQVRNLESVAYGNGTFVAVGDGLTIMTSKDGTNWINRSSEITSRFVNINFTTETYAAGGDEITVALSEKPRSEVQEPPKPFHLRAVCFGDGVFVAVGDCGEILTSPNGEHWTSPLSGTSSTLNGVTWGNAIFAVVGDDGKILTSRNGMTWTPRNSGTTEKISGVAYGNGSFVAVGNSGTTLTSSDGMEWMSQTNDTSMTMITIAFGNGIFMVSGFSKSPLDQDFNGQTWTSTDGEVWKEVAHPGSSDPLLWGSPNDFGPKIAYVYNIAQSFGGGLFFATTQKGIYTSRDGENWNPPSDPRWSRSCCRSVAFGNGIYVTVGAIQATASNKWTTISGHGLATSKDGIHWSSQFAPPSRLIWGRLANNGRDNGQVFMATPLPLPNATPFVTGPAVLFSQDRITWSARNKILITGKVCGNVTVCYYGNRFTNGAALYSEDGITWRRLLPKNSNQPATATQITTPSVSGPTYSDVGFQMQLNGQGYKLNLTTKLGEIYELQASTNLQDWVMLTTLTNSGAVLNFIDPDTAKYPQRFYRLKLQ